MQICEEGLSMMGKRGGGGGMGRYAKGFINNEEGGEI